MRQAALPLQGHGEPVYELRGRLHGPGDLELEIRQLPGPASPQLAEPLRVGGLRGRNLELLLPRVLKTLGRVRIDTGGLLPGETRVWPMGEELALGLALLFRTTAPMRSAEAIRAVAAGIEAMRREEAGYWLGMTLHRANPRRVLAALRLLLTDPRR